MFGDFTLVFLQAPLELDVDDIVIKPLGDPDDMPFHREISFGDDSEAKSDSNWGQEMEDLQETIDTVASDSGGQSDDQSQDSGGQSDDESRGTGQVTDTAGPQPESFVWRGSDVSVALSSELTLLVRALLSCGVEEWASGSKAALRTSIEMIPLLLREDPEESSQGVGSLSSTRQVMGAVCVAGGRSPALYIGGKVQVLSAHNRQKRKLATLVSFCPSGGSAELVYDAVVSKRVEEAKEVRLVKLSLCLVSYLVRSRALCWSRSTRLPLTRPVFL